MILKYNISVELGFFSSKYSLLDYFVRKLTIELTFMKLLKRNSKWKQTSLEHIYPSPLYLLYTRDFFTSKWRCISICLINVSLMSHLIKLTRRPIKAWKVPPIKHEKQGLKTSSCECACPSNWPTALKAWVALRN